MKCRISNYIRFLRSDQFMPRSSEKRDSRRAPERGDALVSYPGYSSQSSHPVCFLLNFQYFLVKIPIAHD